jgi:subtilisin family serine protease
MLHAPTGADHAAAPAPRRADPARRRTLIVVAVGAVLGVACGTRAALAQAPAGAGLVLDRDALVVVHDFAHPVFVAAAAEGLGSAAAASEYALAHHARLDFARPLPSDAALADLAAHLSVEPGIAFVAPRLVDAAGNGVVVGRELLVAFEPWVGGVLARDVLLRFGEVVDVDVAGMADVYRVRCELRSGFDVLAAAEVLDALPETRWCEPDAYREVRQEHVPNDPLYGLQWALSNQGQFGGVGGFDLGAAQAWDTTTGSSNVVVAVIDDGVETSHLDVNTAPGADFTGQGGGGAPTNACDRHGTAVAGCIAGRIDNGLGTVGIAPGVRVASLKVVVTGPTCNGYGLFQTTWFLAALAHCEANGIRITNTSLGFASSTAIAEKFASTRAAGILHLCSAGNSGGAIGFPASLPEVLAVGALAPTGARAAFSAHGPELDLVAPGQSLWTLDRTGTNGYTQDDYAVVDGTSFAAPYAAGVAALALSLDQTLTVAALENLLAGTAHDLGTLGPDHEYGHGLVSAAAVVAALATHSGPPIVSGVEPATPFVLVPDDGGRLVVTGTGLSQVTGVRLGGATLPAGSLHVVGDGRLELDYTRLAWLGPLDLELVYAGGSVVAGVDVAPVQAPALELAASWPDGIDRAQGLEIVVAARPGDVYYLIGSVFGTPTLVPGIVAAGIGGGDLANVHLLAIGVVDGVLGSNLVRVPVAGLPLGLNVHLQAGVLDGLAPSLPLSTTNVQSGTLVQ